MARRRARCRSCGMDRDRQKKSRRRRKRAGGRFWPRAGRAAAGLSREDANARTRHSGSEKERQRRAANRGGLDRDDQSSLAVRRVVPKRTVAAGLHREAGKPRPAPHPRCIGTIGGLDDIRCMPSSRLMVAAVGVLLLADCTIPMASAAPSRATPPPVAGKYGATESRIFELINAQRRRK